tara:strand:+ start:2717 stop:2974 length:258 start_codon:yes stop_codon:yes gene_type:complete
MGVIALLIQASVPTGDDKLIVESGLTIIVKVFVDPEQLMLPLLKVGVTTIVAVTGLVPEFVAVKEGIFPVPEDANPIEGLVFVHE